MKNLLALCCLAFVGCGSAGQSAPVITGIVIGDSVSAAYGGAKATTQDFAALSHQNIISTAVPSSTIAAQKALYDALPDKSGSYVIMELGLVDLFNNTDLATIVGQYQAFINDIAASSHSRIYLSAATPCRQFMVNQHGQVAGDAIYQRWLALNANLRQFQGISGVIDAQVSLLNDGSGNLLSQYDLGDGIHPNDAGRQIIAKAWYDKLIQDHII